MNKPNNIPRISEAEWKVMKILWAKSPLTTNEVVDALTPDEQWKPKTIMTMLNRLVKKSALAFKKQGRAYQYYPIVDQEDLAKAETTSFLHRVYDGALTPMLASFVEDANLSPDQIEELKRILDKKEK